MLLSPLYQFHISSHQPTRLMEHLTEEQAHNE